MKPEHPDYPSFDQRAERLDWQWATLNPHPPLVKGDISATWLVCFAFVAFLVLFVGLVAWPGRAT